MSEHEALIRELVHALVRYTVPDEATLDLISRVDAWLARQGRPGRFTVINGGRTP